MAVIVKVSTVASAVHRGPRILHNPAMMRWNGSREGFELWHDTERSRTMRRSTKLPWGPTKATARTSEHGNAEHGLDDPEHSDGSLNGGGLRFSLSGLDKGGHFILLAKQARSPFQVSVESGWR